MNKTQKAERKRNPDAESGRKAYLKYYKSGQPLKTVKTDKGISETRLVKKKALKKELSIEELKQRKRELAEKKDAALKKFERWGHEKTQSALKTFEELVKKGKKDNYIMIKLEIKDRTEYRLWIESKYSKQDRKITLKDIRQSIYSKAGTATENWRDFRGEAGTFENRLNNRFCPIVSTGDRSVDMRKYPPVLEGETFCEEIKIIPDLSVQPIKRLRIAAHSYITAKEWNNGEKLKELSVECCKTESDKYLTYEGGIIISKTLHEAEGLDKGDKLLGLHGLKGIICEVRDMKNDLLINKAQIWGKKSSAKNGGAVLELQKNGRLACFFQESHTIREKIFKDEEGMEYARGKFSPRARYSADFVPFLLYHVGFKNMIALTERNRRKTKDILRFLNATFTRKEGQIIFKPLLTQCEPHGGGKCEKFGGFFYSKRIWREPLDKTGIVMYDQPFYHYTQENLWIPDWLKGEPYMEYIDKDGITHKTVIGSFVTGKRMGKQGGAPQALIHLLYNSVYGEIENSIGYLIAIPTATEPKVLILNKTDCIEGDIEEDEEVLVWRAPVVSARLPDSKYSEETKHSNILKLKVKYGARQKTAEINTATMRLMFGDFDGDPIYVMKIPPTVAEGLIPGKELDKEIEAVKNDVAELDTIKIPKTRREILLSMRKTFIEENVSKGYTTQKKANIALSMLEKTATKKLRDTPILLREAQRNHNESIIESKKITEIGGLTKWAWMAAEQNELKGLIKATQSIEIMKDRPQNDNENYKTDKEYLTALKLRLSKGERKIGYTNFVKFTSQGAYQLGLEKRRKVPTYVEFAEKALCPSNSTIGKWIQLLVL